MFNDMKPAMCSPHCVPASRSTCVDIHQQEVVLIGSSEEWRLFWAPVLKTTLFWHFWMKNYWNYFWPQVAEKYRKFFPTEVLWRELKENTSGLHRIRDDRQQHLSDFSIPKPSRCGEHRGDLWVTVWNRRKWAVIRVGGGRDGAQGD